MQPVPHLPIPSGLWSAPTRMDFKCFLFAAFFLVACVAFSSQDELTDVEGKATLMKQSTMFSTKKQQQQLTTTIYRAKKSAFTKFILFCINVKFFFFHSYFDFLLFLFIFKHWHSNKQRTMVNEYSYHHHFVFSMSALYLSFIRWKILSKKSLAFSLFCFLLLLFCFYATLFGFRLFAVAL